MVHAWVASMRALKSQLPTRTMMQWCAEHAEVFAALKIFFAWRNFAAQLQTPQCFNDCRTARTRLR